MTSIKVIKGYETVSAQGRKKHTMIPIRIPAIGDCRLETSAEAVGPGPPSLATCGMSASALCQKRTLIGRCGRSLKCQIQSRASDIDGVRLNALPQ